MKMQKERNSEVEFGIKPPVPCLLTFMYIQNCIDKQQFSNKLVGAYV